MSITRRSGDLSGRADQGKLVCLAVAVVLLSLVVRRLRPEMRSRRLRRPLAAPPDAQQPSAGGAEAFVAHFWTVAADFEHTGDSKRLRSLYLTTCEWCTKATRSVVKFHQRGGRGGRGGTSVDSRPHVTSAWATDVIPGPTKVVARVQFRVVSPAHRYVDPATKKVRRAKRSDETNRMRLVFRGGAWKVAGWAFVAG